MHKSHNIICEGAAIKEITIRAECLVDFLKIINYNQTNLFNEEFNRELNTTKEAKKESLKKQINNQFDVIPTHFPNN